MDGERLIAACLANTKDLQQDMLRLEDEARTLIEQSTCADSTSINSSRRNLFFNADDDRYGGMKGSEEDWIPVAPNYDIMIDALPSGIMSGRGSDLGHCRFSTVEYDCFYFFFRRCNCQSFRSVAGSNLVARDERRRSG